MTQQPCQSPAHAQPPLSVLLPPASTCVPLWADPPPGPWSPPCQCTWSKAKVPENVYLLRATLDSSLSRCDPHCFQRFPYGIEPKPPSVGPCLVTSFPSQLHLPTYFFWEYFLVNDSHRSPHLRRNPCLGKPSTSHITGKFPRRRWHTGPQRAIHLSAPCRHGRSTADVPCGQPDASAGHLCFRPGQLSGLLWGTL